MSYYIPITNTLLEAKHIDSMGLSIWLFMWFIDRMTKIDGNGNGKVLGGRSEEHTSELQSPEAY